MRHILTAFLLVTLAACSSLPEEDKQKNASAEQLYTAAKAKLDDKAYDGAIKQYEKLQSRYPYGSYSQTALLEMAYAYIKQGEPDPAIVACDRFIKEFPNNPRVDYAWYLKGLANFTAEDSALKSLSGTDISQHETIMPQDSFNAFKELLARYPTSQYAPDARLRMQFLANALAKHELLIADFYLRRGANLAAVSRAQDILTLYPETPASRDALLIMVKAYDAQGMTTLRDDAQRVLDANGGATSATVLASGKKSWWQFWK
ncbi:MAG: outer membrane protein assembly factor BamD [Sideroxydans sp.]|nr:outer membrane protein assembly factor BamD [Sideroxydans sp.]